MSRLRWPDSTNSVSDVPGTIHSGFLGSLRTARRRAGARVDPAERAGAVAWRSRLRQQQRLDVRLLDCLLLTPLAVSYFHVGVFGPWNGHGRRGRSRRRARVHPTLPARTVGARDRSTRCTARGQRGAGSRGDRRDHVDGPRGLPRGHGGRQPRLACGAVGQLSAAPGGWVRDALDRRGAAGHCALAGQYTTGSSRHRGLGTCWN